MSLTQRMGPRVPSDTEKPENLALRAERDTLNGLRPEGNVLEPKAARGEDPAAAVEGARTDPNALRARRCPTCAQVFSKHARFCPFDGDPLVDAPDWSPVNDPLLGKTVDGRYKVVGVIGEGGMGTVYEVRHTTLDRRFALKVLRRDLAQDAERTARFIQEAKAAASVGHPNIIAVSDFGELGLDTPGGHTKAQYFVMELLTGVTLATLLKSERTLAPLRAAKIFIQCASALEAAHEAGVFHRDLKPDNIFLSEGPVEFVKLLDFGVAKIAGTGRLTRAGMVFGTPHYMSPEQAAGDTVDHRADIYALGVIMYECFAGRVPFEADTYMSVLTQHMFVAPVPLERAAPDPRGLGALAPVVMRCLSKKPESRYATMGEVVQAIQQAIGDSRADGRTSIASAPPSSLRLREVNVVDDGRMSLPSTDPEEVPNRLAVAVAIAAMAVGVIATGWWMLRSQGPKTPSTELTVAPVGTDADPARAAPTGADPASEAGSAAPDPRTPNAAGSARSAIDPDSDTKIGEPPRARPSSAPTTPASKPLHRRVRTGGGEVVDPWDN